MSALRQPNLFAKTQLEIIRDMMLSAKSCQTWLTLDELHAMTKFPVASISAQLRFLRRPEFGAYIVLKRKREIAHGPHTEKPYEYQITRSDSWTWRSA